jgi:hypothetical protein
MPAVVFFRKFEEKIVPYSGDASMKSLEKFVNPLMVPEYFEFTDEEGETVFEK